MIREKENFKNIREYMLSLDIDTWSKDEEFKYIKPKQLTLKEQMIPEDNGKLANTIRRLQNQARAKEGLDPINGENIVDIFKDSPTPRNKKQKKKSFFKSLFK